MARSGVAAAKLLSEKGAFVRINDLKTREQLGKALEPLEGLADIEWRLGEKPDELLAGMDMLVISPGVPIESEIVKRAESLGVEVVGEIELSARLSKGRLVAISGTNGKTTTTTLTGEIFKDLGREYLCRGQHRLSVRGGGGRDEGERRGRVRGVLLPAGDR